jgi:hypothetical protein
MEYRVGGLSRLDDARQRALDLVHDLPADSRVAVLDTGEEGGGDEAEDDWIATPAQVRARINGLRVRPVRAPLVHQIERAAELLAKAGQVGQPSSSRLYVFSDRTTTSWDADAAKRVKMPDGIEAVYVDLGVEKPTDLGIDKVEVKPLLAPPGAQLTVHVEVRAVGGDFDAGLLCQIDGESSPASKRVQLAAGKTAAYDFTLKAPTPVRPPSAPEGVYTEAHQIAVKFTTPDDLAFKDDLAHDNIRYATFFVRDDSKRQGRKMLALADDPNAARIWQVALQAYLPYHPYEGFTGEVRPAADAAKLQAADLKPYRAVWLFQTARALPESFWKALQEYVSDGGGLAIVPPVDEMAAADLTAWNNAGVLHRLLPARLRELTGPKEPLHLYWGTFKPNHPLTRPFFDWRRGANPDFADEALKPFVNRYWDVEPIEGKSLVVSTYDNEKASPALVELTRGDAKEEETRGRVLLFTTTLDRREVAPGRDWNNFYTDSSFGLELVNETCKYLAGDAAEENPNFVCGVPVVLPLPESAPRGVYRLDAPDPDLTESERTITVGKDDKSIEVRAASAPGQYTLFDPNRNRYTAFSMNVSPDESRLDRLPADEIEKALGRGSVVTVEPGGSLNDALAKRTKDAQATDPPPAPVSLLPTLMVLTLLFLTLEGLFANWFYRRPAAAAGAPAGEGAA